MKGGRYWMLLALLGVWVANVSQAAQQYRQIDAAKGRMVSGTLAAVGGPAHKGSGTRFPVVPAGALVRQVSSPRTNQQNQLPNKTGSNNPAGSATAVKAGGAPVGGNSGLPMPAAGTVSQTANPAPQQQSGAAVGTSRQPVPTASGTSTTHSHPVPQQQKATASGKNTADTAAPTGVSGQNPGSARPKQ